MRYEPPQRIHYCHLSLSLSLTSRFSSKFLLSASKWICFFSILQENDTVFTIRVGLYSRSQIAGFTAQLAPKPLIYIYNLNLNLKFFYSFINFQMLCYRMVFFLVLWKAIGFLLFPNFSNCFVKLGKKLAKKWKIPRLKK